MFRALALTLCPEPFHAFLGGLPRSQRRVFLPRGHEPGMRMTENAWQIRRAVDRIAEHTDKEFRHSVGIFVRHTLPVPDKNHRPVVRIIT